MATATTFPTRPRTMPAWALSAITHAVLLTLVAFWWTQAPVPVEKPGLDRPVAIVLASADPSRATEYFNERDLAASEARAAVAADEVVTPEAALPAAAMASELAGEAFSLPALDSAAIAAEEGVLQSPQLTVSGRSRVPAGFDPAAIFAEEAARKRAIAARGPATSLGLFGSEQASGRSFVFLIDRSKSMGGGGLGAMAAAEDELLRAVEELRPNHKFQVVAYHHQCVFLLNKRSLLPATEENKASIRGFLSGLAAFGATEHLTGLRTALQIEPDVIFLLTDGGYPHLSAVDLARIDKLAGNRTAIHCIQFGSGPRQGDANFLQRLAAYCNGGYGYVDMAQSKK